MNRTRSIVSASHAAQNHAALVRGAIGNAALTARDRATPVVETVVHHAKVAGVYAGSFLRTLVGK